MVHGGPVASYSSRGGGIGENRQSSNSGFQGFCFSTWKISQVAANKLLTVARSSLTLHESNVLLPQHPRDTQRWGCPGDTVFEA